MAGKCPKCDEELKRLEYAEKKQCHGEAYLDEQGELTHTDDPYPIRFEVVYYCPHCGYKIALSKRDAENFLKEA